MPVWGSDFVRQFLDYCLPTLLAPGNIPGLAQALPTRFVLLTRASDLAVVSAHPAWQRLSQTCRTELQTIDDLIAEGHHHATVTLAYVRALRAAGEAVRDTVFLFLVGDYLVSDGSLCSVLKRIQAGANGVLSGALQINAGAIAALLRERMSSSTYDLVLSPRLLVGWALAQLDPRSSSSVDNSPLPHGADANRLFWSVDQNTLIGRFYLLHMIAIRPEVTDFVVGAPCDYSFVPELCPSGRVEVMTNSDDYLVVEMHAGDRVAGSPRSGSLPPPQLARSLSRWTTARHRQNAQVTLIFHADEIPGEIAATDAMASAFIARIGQALAPRPQPYRDHPFWIGMMALQRADRNSAPDIDELTHLLGTAPSDSGLTGLSWQLRLRMLGSPPAVSIWHPRWPDFHSAYVALQTRLDPAGRLLVISDAPRAFARWLAPLCEIVEGLEWGAVSKTPADGSISAAEPFDACFCVMEPGRIQDREPDIDRISRMLAPGGFLLIFVTADLDAEIADLHPACAELGSRLRQSDIPVEQTHCVPAGPLRVALARALAGTIRAGRGSSRALLPLLLVAGATIATAVLGCNLLSRRQRSPGAPRGNCSSILLAGQRPAGAAMIDCRNARGYQGMEIAPSRRARAPRAGGLELALCVEPWRPQPASSTETA
jgi:hypothetical protein